MNNLNSIDLHQTNGGLDPLSLFIGAAISFVVAEFTAGYWDAENVEY
jgi:hypothetical protein